MIKKVVVRRYDKYGKKRYDRYAKNRQTNSFFWFHFDCSWAAKNRNFLSTSGFESPTKRVVAIDHITPIAAQELGETVGKHIYFLKVKMQFSIFIILENDHQLLVL